MAGETKTDEAAKAAADKAAADKATEEKAATEAAKPRRVKKALVVTAPLVTARTENDRIVYLYHGDVVPDGLAKGSIEHLTSLGFIAEQK